MVEFFKTRVCNSLFIKKKKSLTFQDEPKKKSVIKSIKSIRAHKSVNRSVFFYVDEAIFLSRSTPRPTSSGRTSNNAFGRPLVKWVNFLNHVLSDNTAPRAE